MKFTATHELQSLQEFSRHHHLQNKHKHVKFGPTDQEIQGFEEGPKLIVTGRTKEQDFKMKGTLRVLRALKVVKRVSSPPQWGRMESTRLRHVEETPQHA